MTMWLADIKIALASLRATKTRTLLTTLGIVVGVASVTTILALGQGIQQTIETQATQFDGEVATVRPGQLLRDENGDVQSYDLLANLNAGSLTERDLEIVAATPGVQAAAPIMGLRGGISNQGFSMPNSQIIATNEKLPEVLNQNVRIGQFVDSEISENTAVLGSGLADRLLGSNETIGDSVTIRGQQYTVIGILERFDIPLSVNGLYNANNAAYLTLEAGQNLNQGAVQIQTINFRIANGSNEDEVIARVGERLRDAHNANDVAVIGSKAALQIIENFFVNITGYTAAIAAISLLVGGIGVMNIMLVAVTERTREIGIRKAVGATNGQILRQFLTESVVMAVVGGLVGLGVAVLAGVFISLQFGLPTAFSWNVVGWALGVAVLVGIVFGMFPALRAARKDPIAALRQL